MHLLKLNCFSESKYFKAETTSTTAKEQVPTLSNSTIQKDKLNLSLLYNTTTPSINGRIKENIQLQNETKQNVSILIDNFDHMSAMPARIFTFFLKTMHFVAVHTECRMFPLLVELAHLLKAVIIFIQLET